MPKTEPRGGQIRDETIDASDILNGSVGRNELNTTTAGQAVVTKVIAGTGVTINSTGQDAGTGDVTVNAAGAGGETAPFTQTIGNGTATSFDLAHDFATRDVIVTVYANSDLYDDVDVVVSRPDVNTVRVDFVEYVPATNAFRVVIAAYQGAQAGAVLGKDLDTIDVGPSNGAQVTVMSVPLLQSADEYVYEFELAGEYFNNSGTGRWFKPRVLVGGNSLLAPVSTPQVVATSTNLRRFVLRGRVYVVNDTSVHSEATFLMSNVVSLASFAEFPPPTPVGFVGVGHGDLVPSLSASARNLEVTLQHEVSNANISAQVFFSCVKVLSP